MVLTNRIWRKWQDATQMSMSHYIRLCLARGLTLETFSLTGFKEVAMLWEGLWRRPHDKELQVGSRS